jgi:hypothetical protein
MWQDLVKYKTEKKEKTVKQPGDNSVADVESVMVVAKEQVGPALAESRVVPRPGVKEVVETAETVNKEAVGLDILDLKEITLEDIEALVANLDGEQLEKLDAVLAKGLEEQNEELSSQQTKSAEKVVVPEVEKEPAVAAKVDQSVGSGHAARVATSSEEGSGCALSAATQQKPVDNSVSEATAEREDFGVENPIDTVGGRGTNPLPEAQGVDLFLFHQQYQ